MSHWVGIDPGSQAAGFAAVERTGAGYEVRICEALTLPKGALPDRLERLHAWLKAHLDAARPIELVAIETPFVGRSVRSALTLGIVEGLIRGLLIERGIPLLTLSPAEIKRAITGRAHASKEQVAATLRHHLAGEIALPDSDHATDALAIALAAAYHQNSPITRRFTRRAER